MAFQLLPNLIFFASVAALIYLVVRRLPQALGEPDTQMTGPEDRLLEKGLPVEVVRKSTIVLRSWAKRFWNFALEAKDLRHNSVIGYRIKTILQQSPIKRTRKVVVQPREPSEQYYLELIKRYPDELSYYEALAEFYQRDSRLDEARTVYEYLAKHDPTNPTYLAKQGFMELKLSHYDEAINDYEQSLKLDSAHPSRYYNLGLAYKMAQKSAEAKEALQKALELDPGNEKYRQVLENIE